MVGGKKSQKLARAAQFIAIFRCIWNLNASIKLGVTNSNTYISSNGGFSLQCSRIYHHDWISVTRRSQFFRACSSSYCYLLMYLESECIHKAGCNYISSNGDFSRQCSRSLTFSVFFCDSHRRPMD